MSDKYISGKISFIHHDKDRAVIEYEENGKRHTIQADIAEKAQSKLIDQKLIKKTHRFLIGDNVKFLIKKTGGNGRILYADNILYQYNTLLEILINKAAIENKFLGYIKITDHEYFIKEIDTYLFFPLKISEYEIPPTEKEIEKPVTFKLEDISKPDKVSASLYNHHYIPEFLTAVQHFKKQEPIEATVSNITKFAIHLDLVSNKIKARLNLDEEMQKEIEKHSIKIGSTMTVKIKHISTSKIAVEVV
ncbi:MAG: hypothetical protein ABIT58_03910 [Ferruginibacter sp.]